MSAEQGVEDAGKKPPNQERSTYSAVRLTVVASDRLGAHRTIADSIAKITTGKPKVVHGFVVEVTSNEGENGYLSFVGNPPDDIAELTKDKIADLMQSEEFAGYTPIGENTEQTQKKAFNIAYNRVKAHEDALIDKYWANKEADRKKRLALNMARIRKGQKPLRPDEPLPNPEKS